MALTSTIFNFDLDVSDIDRAHYFSKSIAIARHPSETTAFMLTRVLAYALEHEEQLEFSRGLSESDEPALWAKDYTGTLTAWIEVGSPSPERLHRARKLCEHVAIYGFRDPRQQLALYRDARIYRAETIFLYTIDGALLSGLEQHVSKRNKLSISRSEGVLYCDLAQAQLHGSIAQASLAAT